MAPGRTKAQVQSKAADGEPTNKAPRLSASRTLSIKELPTEERPFGNLLACGTGDVGQLGLGEDVLEKMRPALIANIKDIVSISAGGMHSIVLTRSGEVFTFGCNDEGALGRVTNDDGSEFMAVKIDLPGKAIKISAGDSHSACLLEDGSVFAWGSFRDSHGSMGLTNEGTTKSPIRIAPGIKFVDIASGTDHLVILTTTGKFYTMGCGEQGQLGRAPPRSALGESRRGKTDVLQPKLGYIKNIRTSADAIWATSYCTFVRELNTDNIYGCGLNNFNQLALKHSGDPVFFPMLTNLKDVKKIEGGQHHTLVMTNSNKVYVIGRKDYGRLGIAGLTDNLEELTLIKSLENKNIVDISCGDQCSFALAQNGEVYAWGFGSNYQLGLGKDDDVDTPNVVSGAQVKGKKLIRVASGGQHSLFIVDAEATDVSTTEKTNNNEAAGKQTTPVLANGNASGKSIQSEEISTSTKVEPGKKAKKRKN